MFCISESSIAVLVQIVHLFMIPHWVSEIGEKAKTSLLRDFTKLYLLFLVWLRFWSLCSVSCLSLLLGADVFDCMVMVDGMIMHNKHLIKKSVSAAFVCFMRKYSWNVHDDIEMIIFLTNSRNLVTTFVQSNSSREATLCVDWYLARAVKRESRLPSRLP